MSQSPPGGRGGGDVARQFRLAEEAFGRLVGRPEFAADIQSRPIARRCAFMRSATLSLWAASPWVCASAAFVSSAAKPFDQAIAWP